MFKIHPLKILTHKNVDIPLKYTRHYVGFFLILLRLYYQKSMSIAELENYFIRNVSKVWTSVLEFPLS